MGYQSWGKDSGDTKGSDCRNQNESHACDGLVWQKVEGGLEIDFSNDGGKRKDGVSSTHGSIMGVDAEPRAGSMNLGALDEYFKWGLFFLI